MKKILAIVLALCLALSLSVAAFAVDSAGIDSPVIPNPGIGSAPSGVTSSTAGKYTYSVTTASGLSLTASIDAISTGDIYNELAGAGVVAMYYISITSTISPDEIVSIDVFAPGVTNDCAVVVRDAWEVLPEVTMAANGNRATITGPAGIFNTWHYVAIVSNTDSDVIVNTPQEPTDTDEEEENVDAETPAVDVEPDAEPEAQAPAADDSNPTTGIALAVVPMIVAAAAVVVSKKR